MKINLRYLLFISIIAALGGLLFGYDWVVIGGAKPFYEQFFHIAGSPNLQGWAMSSALAGCIPGALLAGELSDRFGRKKTLMVAALLFTLAGIGTGMINTLNGFIVYRLTGGIGIGLASAISPVYISEVSPPHLRGRFVSINQLTIVIGILAAQVVNYLIARPVPEHASDLYILQSWNGQTGWRWMFWAEAFPAFLFLVMVIFVPESPRWLAKVSRWNESVNILKRIGGTTYAESARDEIAGTLAAENDKVDYRKLFSPRIRPILWIGIILAVFQQWCGINVVFNYAEEVFKEAGYGVNDILFNIVITGTINLIFTLVAMRTVDQWGRKKLMLFGAAGLAITYISLGTSYYFAWKDVAILIIIILAMAVYAMSLAPVTWVVLSEIFPNQVRGAAMSVATAALWIACFVLTYTFPVLRFHLKIYGTFWLYALICVAGFLYVYSRLPETRGKSLEEIEKQLTGE